MSPVSSASGTNSIGGTRPRSGCSQRISASNPNSVPVVEVDHRLVVHAHLAALDGAVQLVAGAQVVDRAVVFARVEQLGAVAAQLLGAVHRRVGVAQQRLGRVGAAARQRDADARGHEHLAFHERDRPRDRLGEPLRDELDGLLAGHVVAEDRELVAAEAGDDVVRAHGRAQPVGHGHEQAVAGRVTEAVVHHLEAVEVEEQHRDALAVAARRRASSRPRRSTNCSRFGRPVSGSCTAWCASASPLARALADVFDLADRGTAAGR